MVVTRRASAKRVSDGKKKANLRSRKSGPALTTQEPTNPVATGEAVVQDSPEQSAKRLRLDTVHSAAAGQPVMDAEKGDAMEMEGLVESSAGLNIVQGQQDTDDMETLPEKEKEKQSAPSSSHTPPNQLVKSAVSCPPAPSLAKPPNPSNPPPTEEEVQPPEDVTLESPPNQENGTPDTEMADTAATADHVPRSVAVDQHCFSFTTTSVTAHNPHPSQAGPPPAYWTAGVIPPTLPIVNQAKAGTKAAVATDVPSLHQQHLSLPPGPSFHSEGYCSNSIQQKAYAQHEDTPLDIARKTLLHRARTVAHIIQREKASAAMPPPPRPATLSRNICDPKKIKDMIINDMLKDIHSKATVYDMRTQPHAFLREFPMKGSTFYDGFDNTWLLPDAAREVSQGSGVVVPSREYETSDPALVWILQDEAHRDVVQRAYRWIERETQAKCSIEWNETGGGDIGEVSAPAIPLPWNEAKAKLSMNDMVEMVCKHHLLEGTVCFPGYFTINVVVCLQGRLIATPHHVPPNLRLDTLLEKLDMWDPPAAGRVGVLLRTVRYKIATAKRDGFEYARTKALEYGEELKRSRFQLDVLGSERRAWNYKL